MKRFFLRMMCSRRPAPRAALALLLTMAAAPAWPVWGAEPLGFKDDILPANLATLQAQMEPAQARAGEQVRLIVTAHILPGWHIYSLEEQGKYGPRPTRVVVPANDLQAEGPVYETDPLRQRDPVFDLSLSFHKQAARFYQNFKVPAESPPGERILSAQVAYQVCNDKFCTPPQHQTLASALTIEGGPPRPDYLHPLRTIDYLDASGRFHETPDTLGRALQGGLAGFLLLALGFGALALLTPCVFPMIPVTVSFFTGASQQGSRGAGLAILFGLGIVVTYSGLGLALTFLLGATGVARFATNPWVNLAVAAFFAVFALSLLGLLELSLPSAWVQVLQRASVSWRGPAGVLMMGVAFTAANFTCTLPFVGTLLLAAAQGQVFWPILGMLTFSVAFALPLFLLALFPRWLLKLRGKGGPWLVQLKLVLGLLELAAALKFVSNADIALQWGWVDRPVVLALWALLALLAALVLWGLLPWPGLQRGARGPWRLAWGVLLVAVSAYWASGLPGRELDAYTESYLPPPAAAYLAGTDGLTTPANVLGLPWLADLQAGLAQAARERKPVFIDFTGYTCVNCRWMEKRIFAQPNVLRHLRERFVLVQLFTDGGPNAERNERLEIERFQTVALPYYVVLGPDNAVLARHGGIVPSADEFLAFLDRGAFAMRAEPTASR